MKQFLLILLTAWALLFSSQLWSQDKKVAPLPDWALNPAATRLYVSGTYPMLPPVQDNYVNPNTETRVVRLPIGTLVLLPNIRPFPHTATQSEMEAVSETGNQNVMWASWNSFGPTFYGTGFCYTSNGGTNWSGNFQMFTPNSGDPGPWVWSVTSPWPGRLGISVIGSQSIASYSTDAGVTWQPPVGMGGSGVDKNLSCVDDVPSSPFFGRAYTVWTDFSGANANRIVGAYTTNGGVSWTGYGPVSPVPASGHHCQGCDVEVGPGGVVYACWGHCTTNGQNSTEDNLGFAKSTDGGVTWAVTNNNVVDINGIRAANLFNGIRANGFPRIAVDKTGGTYNGNIYVVLAEKAGGTLTLDVADATMCKSTDGGTTWTHFKVNQDPSNGRYQYFSAVTVDPNGGVNVSYYDQRNTTGFVTEYWMSRSINGGSSFSDVAASDHSFTPAPIPGLAGGYQGDYTGICAGNGKVWPFWADNSSGIYQCWTTDISITSGGSTVNRALRLPTPGVNTNYVAIPHQASMVGFPNITIESWVKIGGSTTANTVLNHGGLSFDYQLGINSSTTNPFFRAQGIIVIATTVTITPLVWTHLAATYDGTTVRFYKDGALAFSQVQAAPLGTSTNEMRIGRGNADPGSGNLEEMRLWTVARTQGQIDSNKCRKYPSQFSSTTGLRALWHFDSTYTDSISNYNGTTSGTVGFDTVSFPIPGANCTLVGITPITGEVPREYVLEQNYPNPFNPMTTIKFSIPKSEFVEIKLYDLLGREVAVVVSDPFEGGTYAVDFDASKLASGVYFYRIEAGEFNDVKKMLLVK